ncbi:MAG: hypothetical protein QOI57_3114 [Rubrobacteraceae bacterium]|nr:hypothetical protein [Rubrobacteraceae bacterium]
MATSAQEFVLCAADHSVLRCLLPDLLYPSDPFSLQSEAHTSPLSSANLTNSPREGKSFCNQRHCLHPDTKSFGKATTLSYSPNLREGVFAATQFPRIPYTGNPHLSASSCAVYQKGSFLIHRTSDVLVNVRVNVYGRALYTVFIVTLHSQVWSTLGGYVFGFKNTGDFASPVP